MPPLPLPLDPPEQPATVNATDAAAMAAIVQRFTVAVLPCPVSPYQPNWFRPMRTSVVHTTVEVKDDAESMPAFMVTTTHHNLSVTEPNTFKKTQQENW
ncbi:MAG TPA: hypothetical protein VGM75_36335 [Pseudonocardiaceae bacterium]